MNFYRNKVTIIYGIKKSDFFNLWKFQSLNLVCGKMCSACILDEFHIIGKSFLTQISNVEKFKFSRLQSIRFDY